MTVGESEYNELLTMQGKLGSLVLKIQKIVESAHIDINELKQLLILSFQFKINFQRAKNFSNVFVVVRKLCSPLNIEVLMLIANHFKLSDAIRAIQAYEFEQQNYRRKLLSTAFAQELKREVELMNRHPTQECIIFVKLKWSRAEHSTVKEFEIVVKNVFLDYSQYIHLCKVDEGCIFVTMCAPTPLLSALVKVAKTRLSYLLDIGVIMLQIGDEIILDKRDKKVYNKILLSTYSHIYINSDVHIVNTCHSTQKMYINNYLHT